MPAQQMDWTAEMARALPDDGKRYEVLDGELFVTPAPSWDHQSLLQRLNLLLARYVEEHGLGWTRFSPADIEFSPRRLVDPHARVLERWGPDDERPEILADALRCQPRAGVAPLAIDLTAFFASALD